MSIQAMSWVFEASESEGSARLVLLAVANHANKETATAWPSLNVLCEEANVSRSTVLRCIEELTGIGELVVERGGEGRGDTNRYFLPKLQEWMEGLRRVKEKGFHRVSELGDKGVMVPLERVSSENSVVNVQSQPIEQFKPEKGPETENLEPKYLEPKSIEPEREHVPLKFEKPKKKEKPKPWERQRSQRPEFTPRESAPSPRPTGSMPRPDGWGEFVKVYQEELDTLPRYRSEDGANFEFVKAELGGLAPVLELFRHWVFAKDSRELNKNDYAVRDFLDGGWRDVRHRLGKPVDGSMTEEETRAFYKKYTGTYPGEKSD